MDIVIKNIKQDMECFRKNKKKEYFKTNAPEVEVIYKTEYPKVEIETVVHSRQQDGLIRKLFRRIKGKAYINSCDPVKYGDAFSKYKFLEEKTTRQGSSMKILLEKDEDRYTFMVSGDMKHILGKMDEKKALKKGAGTPGYMNSGIVEYLKKAADIFGTDVISLFYGIKISEEKAARYLSEFPSENFIRKNTDVNKEAVNEEMFECSEACYRMKSDGLEALFQIGTNNSLSGDITFSDSKESKRSLLMRVEGANLKKILKFFEIYDEILSKTVKDPQKETDYKNLPQISGSRNTDLFNFNFDGSQRETSNEENEEVDYESDSNDENENVGYESDNDDENDNEDEDNEDNEDDDEDDEDDEDTDDW